MQLLQKKPTFSALIRAAGKRYFATGGSYVFAAASVEFTDLFDGVVTVQSSDITEIVLINSARADKNNAQVSAMVDSINAIDAEIPGAGDILRKATDLRDCHNALLFCKFYGLPLSYPINIDAIDVDVFRSRHIAAVNANQKTYTTYVRSTNDVQKDVILGAIADAYQTFLNTVNNLSTVKDIYGVWPNIFLPAPSFYSAFKL